MKRKGFIIVAIFLFATVLVLYSAIARADIQVYDNDNQYLGLLLELDRGHFAVFVPSASASWDHAFGDNPDCPALTTIYFDSSDCTGTPYVGSQGPEIWDLSNFNGGFYKADYNGKKTITPGSYLQSDCSCQTSTGSNQEYYPLVQVQVPFTTPLAWPLRFEVRTRAVVIPLP